MLERTKLYGEDYFERGLALGISGYMNYSWMPELTVRMAHYILRELEIAPHARVLDYGCAKGYLVKALRILDINAYGVDISDYAVSEVPREIESFCHVISSPENLLDWNLRFDWVISKDVFEHIAEAELPLVLRSLHSITENLFVAVPLGCDDHSGKFVIPAYNNDVTHVTIKTKAWWTALFEEFDWQVEQVSDYFLGMKENWTKHWDGGNAFFRLRGPSF
jgi:SAM-dependent methyltransferase